MSAISQRPSPWVWALGLSIVLHALGLGRGLLSPTPAPAREPGHTLSVFVVPKPGVAVPPSAALQSDRRLPAPRPIRRKPAPAKHAPPPVQAPPTASAQDTSAAPPQDQATAAAPIVPVTAELFGPITQQSWGQGRWGRSRRTVSADTLAQQAQQPLVLHMTVQSRLAAMSEVMRQSQLSPECDIRIHPPTLQAQISCQPESLQSAAWSSLQGLLSAGDVAPGSEVWCLRWTAWETATVACPGNPAGTTALSP